MGDVRAQVGGRGAVRALLVAVVAALLAGALAAAGAGMRPAPQGGPVLAHDGTIIVEN